MDISLTEIQIIFLIITLGFLYFVNQAWKGKGKSHKLRSFFLADEKLGAERTENNTLGITFAWSGGTWFYVLGAFLYGPLILLVQPAWCLSLIILSILFTRIHSVTRNKTIHGFLHDSYGPKVRKVASFATTFGYIFNTGFEIYWSSLLFCYILGHPELSLVVAVFIGLLVAVYCNIGGYKANAATDKPQNLIGVFSLAALVLIVVFKSGSTTLTASGIIFSVGAVLYIIFSLLTTKIKERREKRFNNIVSVFAIILAVLAILLSIFLSTDTGGINTYKGFTPISTTFFIGMIAFMLVFNIIDMANWQSIAANGEIDKSRHKSLRWSLIRSGLYVNWFPSLGGILIGLALRVLFSDLTDKNIFHFAFAQVLPGETAWIRGIVLGVLLLGFLATAISSADSYLMSAVQTLMYDLLHHKEIKDLLQKENKENEVRLVKKAKSLLFPIVMIMIFFFWGCYSLYDWATEGKRSALDFQMIIYSFAITLLIPALYALFKGVEKSWKNRTATLWGIGLGMLASILPYIYVIVWGTNSEIDFDIVNLTPVYSLVITGITFYLGLLFNKRQT